MYGEIMSGIDNLELNTLEMENNLLEHFGDKFLEDAIRIVQTGKFSPVDAIVIHEAMSIVISLYVRKIKDGEINQGKVLH